MVDQKYFSIQEASKMLGCDDETLLAQIHSGELSAVNIAKKVDAKRPTWRIAESELGRWLLRRSNSKPTVAPKIEKRPKPKQYV
jgi:excisionase family DNA binding protein